MISKVYPFAKQLLQLSDAPFKAEILIADSDQLPHELNVYGIIEPEVVIKHYESVKPLWRILIGKGLIAREKRAMQRLSAMRCVPTCYGGIGSAGLVMQKLEGRIPQPEDFTSDPGLIEQLENLVDDMHAQGVTHNDLRPHNMLLDAQGRLFVIDFAGAFLKNDRPFLWSAPRRWLFNWLSNADRSKAARLKARYHPDQLTESDKLLISRTQLFRGITQFWKTYLRPWLPGGH